MSNYLPDCENNIEAIFTSFVVNFTEHRVFFDAFNLKFSCLFFTYLPFFENRNALRSVHCREKRQKT